MGKQSGENGKEVYRIPVIDVGPLRSPDLADRQRVADEIRAAALDKGFFYALNHGVSQDLIDRVFKNSADFFALPLEEKMKTVTTTERPTRGYSPMKAIRLDPDAPPDYKDSMTIGREFPEDDPRVLAGRFDRFPNRWPEGMPEFREVMELYFSEVTGLRNTLMRGIALSLGLQEDFYKDYCVEGIDTISLLHYPPQPANPEPGETGSGAHYDFGGVTILLQDSNGGLQVLDEENGVWVDAPPMEGAFVVNLGDQIQRWTEGRYKSNLHRVINFSGKERYSVPFFSNGNPDFLIERLDCFKGEEGLKKFEPITVENYLKRRAADVQARLKLDY